MSVPKNTLEEALSEIVSGKGVARSKHELRVDGRSVAGEFISALARHGFVETTVAEVDVAVGERVPAFFIRDSIAYFGWVFWEKFTTTRSRKLWGSVIRNAKGDWAIQISDAKATTLYANNKLKIEMDADNPVTI